MDEIQRAAAHVKDVWDVLSNTPKDTELYEMWCDTFEVALEDLERIIRENKNDKQAE